MIYYKPLHMFDVLKIRNTCIYEPQCVRERKREKKRFLLLIPTGVYKNFLREIECVRIYSFICL